MAHEDNLAKELPPEWVQDYDVRIPQALALHAKSSSHPIVLGILPK